MQVGCSHQAAVLLIYKTLLLPTLALCRNYHLSAILCVTLCTYTLFLQEDIVVDAYRCHQKTIPSCSQLFPHSKGNILIDPQHQFGAFLKILINVDLIMVHMCLFLCLCQVHSPFCPTSELCAALSGHCWSLTGQCCAHGHLSSTATSTEHFSKSTVFTSLYDKELCPCSSTDFSQDNSQFCYCQTLSSDPAYFAAVER